MWSHREEERQHGRKQTGFQKQCPVGSPCQLYACSRNIASKKVNEFLVQYKGLKEMTPKVIDIQ